LEGAVPGKPPADYHRLHSTGAPADPLRVIARSWEDSLRPHSTSFDLRRPADIGKASGVGGTAFDASWHWDHLYVDVAPFRFIAEKHQPRSVLDIGCGIGAYLQLFGQHGATRLFGVDGIPPEAAALERGAYRMLDLAQPLALEGMFDLAICVEVAEHMPPGADSVLIDNILRHTAGTIIFSAAAPGQPGVGHINCRDIGYWLGLFAARGWFPQLTDSMGMRALATFSWFRRNLVLLRRGDPVQGQAAIASLVAIGQRPFGWYNQPPGIRAWPFQEALPPAPFGYAA
jgi:SAM-dependent methyltransferase